MKENKYDEESFFHKYSEMNRSKQGLAGAGEWYQLKQLLPDFHDKTVLDLGCGYGWHCVYASEHGAREVIGTDISKRMLEVAQAKHQLSNITYQQAAMEDLVFPDETFDVVLSSLAFHYIEDFETLVSHIAKWMKPQGQFIFSVEHPIFTAEGSQDWYYDTEGNILHFPLDHYYEEGKRSACFLGETVTKYHRTLTTYLNTLLNHDFVIDHIIEPMPPENMLDQPGMRDEMRRPMMLLISATKK